MELKTAELKAEDRLPWHKPEVERLSVSLDTSGELGSLSDGAARATIIE